jgi:predicted dehydrogenase
VIGTVIRAFLRWDLIMKFLEAVVGNQQLNSNINDAVSAAAVCEAVERSAESGQWVSLAPIAGVTAAIR